MKSFKEQYNLSYDTSGFKSGIIDWYNKLIDKNYDNITVADVSKMIRQDVLKDIAIEKAIELFLLNPFDGEYGFGGLLEILNLLDINSLSLLNVDRLKTALKSINFADSEWSNVEEKHQYVRNLESLTIKLESI